MCVKIYSMKKRFIAIIVAVIAVIGCVAAFSACGEEEGAPQTNPYPYYSFTLAEGNTLVLDVSLKSQLPSGAITLPAQSYFYSETAGGEMTRHETALPVAAIADGAFARSGRLTSVTIGNSYLSLGEKAFWGCNALTTVSLSPIIESIATDAFAYCTELKTVTGGGAIKSIGDRAFLSCGKLNTLSLTYADGFAVGEEAFFYTISLRSFDVRNAASVADNAFEGWQEEQTVIRN